ncbi:MAG: DUF6784 domain-containing protein [Thermoproteota archaeon]
MSAEKTQEIKLNHAITTKSLIISILLYLPLLYLTSLMMLYTDKSGTFGTFIIPMIYIIVVLGMLSKLNKWFQLTVSEYLLVFIVISFLGMHSYFVMNAAGHPLGYFSWAWLMDPYALLQSGVAQDWDKVTPSFLFPAGADRFTIAKQLANGLTPGEVFNFSALMVPIIYWTVVTAFYLLVGVFITFAIIGKLWVEKERLVFPMSVPVTYIIKEGSNFQTKSGLPNILNFSDSKVKVFWAVFVIGVLSGINPLITELFPQFPMSQWWGETLVPLTFLGSLWPGIYASGIFFIPQIAVGLLVPNDILYTSILTWFIFGILYQGLAVTFGIIPYQSGMEYRWPWEDVPGWWLPFPYSRWGGLGVGLGIATWLIWQSRDRVKQVLSTLTGKDEIENGLSLREVTMIGVGATILWWLFIIVSGGDVVTGLLSIILVYLWSFLYARVWAEVFWHTGQSFWEGPNAWLLIYNIGTYTSGFPANPTWDQPNLSIGWNIVNRQMDFLGNWDISYSPYATGWLVNIYKMAYETKSNLKDIFYAIIVAGILNFFLGGILLTWMTVHTSGGISSTNLWATWTFWDPAGKGFKGIWGIASGETPLYYWIYAISGIIVTWAIYLLRLKFAWFWIHPVAMWVSLVIPNYMWLTSLIALIIKEVSVRTVGVKKYEEYVVPAASGWTIGFGAVWLLAAILNLFGVVLPKAAKLWI